MRGKKSAFRRCPIGCKRKRDSNRLDTSLLQSFDRREVVAQWRGWVERGVELTERRAQPCVWFQSIDTDDILLAIRGGAAGSH